MLVHVYMYISYAWLSIVTRDQLGANAGNAIFTVINRRTLFSIVVA